MARTRDAQAAAFEFLRAHAKSRNPFNLEDFQKATGWKRRTTDTYVSKQFKDFIARDRDGLRVKPEFLRVSSEEFYSLVTQKKETRETYERVQYRQVVTFEFLLPLSHEGKLKQALDELFYRETLEQRLREVEPSQLERSLPRKPSESDPGYLERACEVVAGMIGGYSISHVNGRFRAAELSTRKGAAGKKRYLIDETTAVVRFEIPCASSREEHGAEFLERPLPEMPKDRRALEDEVATIRGLFFLVFVEAVVRSVRGEDAIWLIENGVRRRLYAWERVRPATKGTRARAAIRSIPAKPVSSARAKSPKHPKAKPSTPPGHEGAHRPSGQGQAGPLIASLRPNDKESRLARYLATLAEGDSATLDLMSSRCFAELAGSAERGNSWARNSLRRLVRAGWVERTGRGTFAITPVGRRGVDALP